MLRRQGLARFERSVLGKKLQPSFPDAQLRIVDAPLGAGPESILPAGVMDSGQPLRGFRNDEK